MACSLNIFSCIQDINRVVQSLAESSSADQKGENDDEESSNSNIGDGWDADPEEWGWTEEAESKPTLSSSWLQDCCISLSPSNDTMAIAKDGKAVFLTSKWDNQADAEPKTKYEVLWSGSLAVEEGECVTDILCIPLASQHRSSQGSPDWTCIIAGFTSGYMRIYLQNGSLMFAQLLHEDPVMRLKCRTWQPHRSYAHAEQVEEIAILYPSALVIIDGFSLFQSLRACRNQLARAQASGIQEVVQPPPLAYKKWQFDGQKHITDIASCGVVTQNLFDQLQTASFIGGYNAVIRSAAPAMSHYVTSGADPFIAVYSAIEGSSPPLISDVAMAVASKLTSAVLSKLSAASGWLGWGSKAVNQPSEPIKPVKPKVEKGTKLPARYGLPDFRRHGNTITLAPNGRLAVTTDGFGRVLLLDIKKGIAVRMWKGYREAECGWIMIDEDDVHESDGGTVHDRHHTHRTALFLVIYAAKRGILEIWRAEQGPRVAAFNIGKDCRLLYAGHGIMGLGHVIRQGQAPPQHTLNCTLIQGDGTLKTISVPFHYALSDKHSRRVRDLHLLKKLIAILEGVKAEDEDGNRVIDNIEKSILDILIDIQTPQLQRQGLQCVLGTVGLSGSVILKAVNTVTEAVNKNGRSSVSEEDDEREDTDSLITFCLIQKLLIQTHASFVIMSSEGDGEHKEPWDRQNKQLAVAQLLGVTKSEAIQFLTSLDTYWQHKAASPTKGQGGIQTSSNKPLTITSFLGCFESSSTTDKFSKRDSVYEKLRPGSSGMNTEEYVGVRKGISNEMRLRLANFLFKHCLSGACPAECISLPLDSSGVEPTNLMDLLVTLWLCSPDTFPDTVDAIFTLHSIVSTISSLTGGVFSENFGADDSAVSPWWERIRHTLAQSTSVARALSLAAVCRSVALGMSTAAKKVQSAEDESHSRDLAVGDWVSISVEIERWNLLVFQLDDLVALKCYVARLPTILGLDHPSDGGAEVTENNVENNELSVLGLLSSGHGAASRTLARCVVHYGVPPELLGQPRRLDIRTIETIEWESGDEDRPDDMDAEVSPENRLEGLNELRLRFPHSLHQDILWATCVEECATQWSADKERADKLTTALSHLRCIHCTALQHVADMLLIRGFIEQYPRALPRRAPGMDTTFDRASLAVLLWKKYLKERISAIVVLMEKVGKAPKDRLCRKAVEMSYSALEEFLKAVKLLLELIIQIDMSEAEVLVLRTEDFWHTGESGPQTITEEALEQPSSNVPLVELHMILVTMMWLIMSLEMKSVKPLTLFDTTSKGAFLKDLSSSPPLSSGVVDEAISQSRAKFLTRALSMAVSSMTSQAPSDEALASAHAHQVMSPDWTAAIFTLAEQLGIDSDPLRRHYVCDLYSAGLDVLGSEVLLSVREKRIIASHLLSIVGQRLAHTLNASESTESVTQLSRLPTNISRWIKHQDPSRLSRRSVPFSCTGDLLSTILTLLPTDSADFTLASSLCEAAKFLFE